MRTKKIAPHKRGDSNKWSVTYRIPGYDRLFYESFSTEEEAQYRAAELNLLKSRGELRPPSREDKRKCPTLGKYLDEYISAYGSTHWGDNQFSVVTRQVRDYVKPAPIAELLLTDIRTADLDRFYNSLLTTSAVMRPGHRERKTVGISVIEKIHTTLRAALNQAVKWGYIDKNPAEYASLPKVERQKRVVWTPEEAKTALRVCDNELLKLSMVLAIGCSMRIGEILGLQWKNVHISDESIKNNSSVLYVEQELKRCDKSSLTATAFRSHVYYIFPEKKVLNPCRTSLVLKAPKTESSKRMIYVPKTVAIELLAAKARQEEQKKASGNGYADHDMVIAWPDGSPVEERIIAKELAGLIEKNGLPKVVFHSLRHLSTSLKLKFSGGDIKAVQGDTGHSQPDMVTEVYGHTFDGNRKQVAQCMESQFFSSEKSGDFEMKKEQIINMLDSSPELVELLYRLTDKGRII